MALSVDRGMVVQAVLDGQLAAEHVTTDELVQAHHLLADAAIGVAMVAAAVRTDVTVFDHAWQWITPN